MEQELRKKAIKRYSQGESPKSIYTDIKRSKNWFFKWLNRYKSGEPEWYKDKSRAPINRPTKISEIEKQRIISVRTHLESQKFAQFGSSAIKWELNKSGYSLPSDSTVKRVLKNEGLIKKNFVRSKRR
jgi:transposase